jgi:hypothetical protein
MNFNMAESSTAANESTGPPPFIVSAQWTGAKPGYVFRNARPEGCGYYLDRIELKKKHNKLKNVMPVKTRRGGTGGQLGVSITDRLANAGTLKEIAAPVDTIHKPITVDTENPGAIPFIESGWFRGAKAGYAYKTGRVGLGYYLDDKDVAEQATQAMSSAIVLAPQSEDDKKMKAFSFQLAIVDDKKPAEVVYEYNAAEAAQAIER